MPSNGGRQDMPSNGCLQAALPLEAIMMTTGPIKRK